MEQAIMQVEYKDSTGQVHCNLVQVRVPEENGPNIFTVATAILKSGATPNDTILTVSFIRPDIPFIEPYDEYDLYDIMTEMVENGLIETEDAGG